MFYIYSITGRLSITTGKDTTQTLTEAIQQLLVGRHIQKYSSDTTYYLQFISID